MKNFHYGVHEIRSNYNATFCFATFFSNQCCANNLISLKSNRLKSNAAQQVKTPEAIVKSVESSGKPTPTSSDQPTPKSKSPSSKSSKSKSGSRSNSRSSSANREIRIEVKPQGMGSKNVRKLAWVGPLPWEGLRGDSMIYGFYERRHSLFRAGTTWIQWGMVLY